jgi:hypothetical protein
VDNFWGGGFMSRERLWDFDVDKLVDEKRVERYDRLWIMVNFSVSIQENYP